MDDLMEIKSLIGDVHKSFEALKETNDANLKSRDALLEEKLSKINSSIDEAQDKLKTIEKDMSRAKLLGEITKTQNPYEDLKAILEKNRYEKGHGIDLLKGYQEVLETKGYQVNIDTQGGYLVQPEFIGVIAGLIREISPLRALANVRQIGTDRAYIPSYDKATAGGWVGETSTRTRTADAKFQMTEVPVHEVYSENETTQKMLDDAGFDFGAWLLGEMTEVLGQLEASAFVLGDGVAKPKGILTYPTTALAWEYGKIAQINSGSAATITTDSLIRLQGSLKTAYRARSTFIANRNTLATLRTFQYTGGNGYIWQPSYQLGQPETILGNPVVEMPDMPDLGANNLSVAFADFNTAYQIVDRAGVRVIRDEVTKKGSVIYNAYRRVGGGVKQFDSIKILKCST